jgi:signal transduction histidine kinase
MSGSTVKTQPNDSWIELLSVIAHDLKTPISAVKGFIELIQFSGPVNDKQRHFSDRALSGLQQMEWLVEMLLDVAWIDAEMPLELGTCDLGDLIDDAVKLMESVAARRNITIAMQIDESVGIVQGDVRRLSQVVNNLLSNAIKYNRDSGQIWINGSGDAQEIRLEFKDTGLGIPESEYDHIFERFFRVRVPSGPKVEGTGLGLAIVKAVVERHRGRIWVESEVGTGSSFLVVLPRHPYERETKEETAEMPRVTDKRADSTDSRLMESSSEQLDALDDNLQETDHDGSRDRDPADV